VVKSLKQILERARDEIVNIEDDGYYAKISKEVKMNLLRDIDDCLATQGLSSGIAAVKNLGSVVEVVEKQPDEQEPVGTVRTCVWNGNGFTISAIVKKKLRYAQQIYAKA
jgi:hypothetical protein